jgi:2-oxoisovalerate dehydrogenase E2 component (dihydrolipoyl transacylase)
MAIKQFRLPDVGEGLTEAEILQWVVAVGEEVKVNQVLVEIETAKAAVELPSPFAGVVRELMVETGQTVDVGTPIISIETAEAEPAPTRNQGGPALGAEPAKEKREPVLVGYGVAQGSTKRRARKAPVDAPAAPPTAVPTPTPSPSPAVAALAPVVRPPEPEPETTEPDDAFGPDGADRIRVLAKPLVRKLAKDLGVDLTVIVPGRVDGVITREEVERAAIGGSAAARPAAVNGASPASPIADRRVPIKGVRKATAAAMVASAFTSPHVTEFLTLDVTRTVKLVDRLRARPEFADVKVSPLLLVAKALIIALTRHPEVNASWDEAAQEIVIHGAVNLGIAAATPRGLIVPNIKNAGQYSLRELALALGSLTATAREGKTALEDLTGGTVTITNVGVFGVDTGTPILNPGEAAILAFGVIRRQPWVTVSKKGESRIKPRWVTTLAVSFDHRLIDGELGSRFLRDVGRVLEDPVASLM